jgi:phosphate ABC transporter permease protein PstC
VTGLFALSVIALTVILMFELFRGSWESIQRFGLGFLVGTTWDPVAEVFGTLPTIVGTVAKAFLALLIAVPISIGSAVYLALYAPRWLRNPLSYLVEMLAAIPSVVFGLWGLFILVPIVRQMQIWLKANFEWFPLFQGPAVYGVGVLAGGIILAIMITPIITAISRDLLRAVPRSQLEAMLALGATRWEAIWKAVLPYARVGLVGAVVLGLGPSLPLPATPTGHSTAVPSPTFARHSGLVFDRKFTQLNVVPEPSKRCTTVIGASGSLISGFKATSVGSLQFLSLPRKMSARPRSSNANGLRSPVAAHSNRNYREISNTWRAARRPDI